MWGGDGEDFFDGGGGSGTDQMWGGADADVFHFDRGEGIDIVKDFENNIDEIQLDNFGFTKADAFDFADQVGADVVFDFGSDGMLTIENTTIGQLQNDLVMV
jgi:Ca2+-binding RTX toxin-like protein